MDTKNVIIIIAIFTAVIKVIIRVIFYMPTLGLVDRYFNLRNRRLEYLWVIFCLVSQLKQHLILTFTIYQFFISCGLTV